MYFAIAFEVKCTTDSYVLKSSDSVRMHLYNPEEKNVEFTSRFSRKRAQAVEHFEGKY
jgi:hypothetical protein